MLTNGQFFSSFVFTLCVIGVLVALAGIVFVAVRMWRLSQPLREWLRHSWITRIIRATGTFLGATLFVRPRQTFISLLATFGNTLRQVPWGICIGILIVYSLPFLVFVAVGTPLRSIIGVAAAGALIGMLCAPFTGWHYKSLGPSRAIGVSLLTIVAGAWGSSMLIALAVSS